MKLISSVVLLIALITPAYAAEFKAIDLYKLCNGVAGTPDDSDICLAYIRGITQGIYLGLYQGRMYERAKMKDCLPTPQNGQQPIDVTQAMLIIKKFFADHPERLNEPDSTLAMEALLKGFHCYFRD
jgi:hypothetical protein